MVVGKAAVRHVQRTGVIVQDGTAKTTACTVARESAACDHHFSVGSTNDRPTKTTSACVVRKGAIDNCQGIQTLNGTPINGAVTRESAVGNSRRTRVQNCAASAGECRVVRKGIATGN